MKDHMISQNITLLEALAIINKLAPEPLVLFVLDDDKRMVGTLTDGDARRVKTTSQTGSFLMMVFPYRYRGDAIPPPRPPK